jgi:HSP20 family molecular chaperone IbpA
MENIQRPSSTSESDTHLKLQIDVPVMKPKYIDIELDPDNGRTLRVTDVRRIEETCGQETEKCFEKYFVLDNAIDGKNITANLADGVFFISAPKKATQEGHTRRTHKKATQQKHAIKTPIARSS